MGRVLVEGNIEPAIRGGSIFACCCGGGGGWEAHGRVLGRIVAASGISG